MEYHNSNIIIDPDYELNNSAIREAELHQTEDSKDDIEKLSRILKEEFDRELITRRKHIENIEERLFKAQKLLHLVRYTLISHYYSNKSLHIDNEGLQEDLDLVNFDGENRIHPALKKLLGNNNTLPILNRNKRKAKAINTNEFNHNTKESSEEPICKKIKLETKDSPLFSNAQPTALGSVRNRKKIKQRIVIGNISKYVPSTEYDNLIYRWMVYVRGPKEKADISNIIQKVAFYLHPSYKPNDVIEISNSPFHLARRGWGEFPIRVQIFFKNPLNKPVNIVHNIKLDKNNTGRQILGNETIVDLYLHEEEHESNDYLDKLIQEEILQENKPHNVSTFKEEIDVSFIKKEDDIFNSPTIIPLNDEHNYSLHYSLQGMQRVKSETNFINNPETSLVYGLEGYVLQEDNKQLTKNIKINHIERKVPVVKVFINNFGKQVSLLTNNSLTNTSDKTDSPRPVLMNQTSEQLIDLNEFKIHIPPNKYNIGELLSYMFEKLPLWNPLANNLNYKCTYPFIALTHKDFCRFNIGKRLSAEWSRAKTIKKILTEINFQEIRHWSTKAILMYGRCHLYTPLATYKMFNRISEEKTLILNSYVNLKLVVNKEFSKKWNKEQDINIDILTDSNDTKIETSLKQIDISDQSLKPHCSFMRQIALNSGVILKNEDVLPNVVWNGAERMLLEAFKSLAKNLIRRAGCHLICNQTYKEGESEITAKYIQVALNERKEFKEITNFQQQKQDLDFFM